MTPCLWFDSSAEGGGPTSVRVDTLGDLRAALADNFWDVVISDHNPPDLDSITVLCLVREFTTDLPVSIVSGSKRQFRPIPLN
jgi:hypothetical protein